MKREHTAAYVLFGVAGLHMCCCLSFNAYPLGGEAVRGLHGHSEFVVVEFKLLPVLYAILGCWAISQPLPPVTIGLGLYVLLAVLHLLMLPELIAPGICINTVVCLVLLAEGLRASLKER